MTRSTSIALRALSLLILLVGVDSQVDNDPISLKDHQEERWSWDSSEDLPRSFFKPTRSAKRSKQKHTNSETSEQFVTPIEASSDGVSIQIGKTYFFENQIKKLVLDSEIGSDEHITIYINGKCFIEISVFESPTNDIKLKKEVKIDSNSEALVPLTRYLFGAKEGNTLELNRLDKFSDKVKFSIRKTKIESMRFDEEILLISSFCSEFILSIQMKKDEDFSERPRIQFYVEASSNDTRLNSREKIEMYVNKGKVIPSRDSHEIRGASAMGTGVNRIIGPRDDSYCFSQECEFSMRLYTDSIEQLSILPKMIFSNRVLELTGALLLDEEIQQGGLVEYFIHNSKPDGLVSFKIVPIHGEVSYKIVFQKDEKNELSKRTEGTEVLFSPEGNWSEIKLVFRNEENFRILFKVDMEVVKKDHLPFLTQDAQFLGILEKDNTTKFLLDLTSSEPRETSVKIDFSAIEGSAELLIIECQNERCDNLDKEEQFQNSKSINFKIEVSSKKSQKDFVDLSFDCHQPKGSDQRLLPISESCLFGVIIRSKDLERSVFQLRVIGQTHTDQIPWNTHFGILANPRTYRSFSLPLTELSENDSEISIRFTLTDGKADVFLSFQNRFPDQKNNEVYFYIQADLFINGGNGETTIQLPIPSAHKDNLFINVFAQEYIALDVLAITGQKAVEDIEMNTLLYQSLTSKDFAKIGSDSYRVKTFQVNLPLDITRNLIVTLNSDSLLSMCVLIQRDFRFEDDCDLKTSGRTLFVSYDLLKMKGLSKFFIRIRGSPESKELSSKNDSFYIQVTQDRGDIYSKIRTPGKVYSFSLTLNSSTNIELDLSSMKKNAFISFDSDDYLLDLSIVTDTTTLGVLQHDVFAFHIVDAFHFKNSYCKSSCLITLVAQTSKESTKLSVTFTIDDIPIQISEGKVATLSAQTRSYLIVKSSESKEDLKVSARSLGETITMFTTSLKPDILQTSQLPKALNKKNFESCSLSSHNPSLVYSSKDFERASMFLLMIEPKDKNTFVHHSGSFFLESRSDNAIDVEAYVNIRKLSPGEAIKSEVSSNQFQYFSVSLSSPKTFSIILSVISGEADLYLNPGHKNYTTTEFFGSASTNHRGDEAVIQSGDFQNSVDFTIGVFAVKDTLFSILLISNSSIFDILPNHYNEIALDDANPVFIDPFQIQKNWRSVVYSDHSASILSKSEFKNMTEISHLTSSEGSDRFSSLVSIEPMSPPIGDLLSNITSNTLLKAVAEGRQSTLTFLVYEIGKPIEALIDRQFLFSTSDRERVTFQANMDISVHKVDVEVKAIKGEFSVQICPEETCSSPSHPISESDSKNLQFSKSSKNKLSETFEKFYIIIEAFTASSFSVYVRPSNGFRELREFQSEVSQTLPTIDQYFFRYLSKKDSQLFSQIRFKIITPISITTPPMLYHSPASGGNFSDPSTFQPAQLLQANQRSSEGFREHEFVPVLKQGYFFVKIFSDIEPTPFRVSLTIDNNFTFDPSGVVLGDLPESKNALRSMGGYFHEEGSLRMVISSCGGFILSKYAFSSYDKTQNKELSMKIGKKNLEYYLFRGGKQTAQYVSLSEYNFEIPSAGLLKLNYTSGEYTIERFGNVMRNIMVQTEFKPKGRSKFVSDYIILPNVVISDHEFFEAKTPDRHTSIINFVKNNKSSFFYSVNFDKTLEVKLSIPQISTSILFDYPELNKAYVTVNFVLMNPADIDTQLKKCGLAATVWPKDSVERVVRVIDLQALTTPPSEIIVSAFFNERKIEKSLAQNDLALLVYASYAFTRSKNLEKQNFFDKRHTTIPLLVKSFGGMQTNSNSLPSPPNYKLLAIVFGILFVALLLFLRRISLRQRIAYSTPGERPNELEISSRNT